MNTTDVIVAGLGTAGAAACMELARRGVRVRGFDALRPPHARGGHHGETRSVRRAYLEGTAYVPMMVRAWELWRRLERDAGVDLLTVTGNLTVGRPDGPAVTGFLASARAHAIGHELLAAAQVRRRWPALRVPDGFCAALEIEAGIVRPERAVATFLAEAEKAGAVMHFDEPVTGWRDGGGIVRVETPAGRFEAGRLLLAAGARGGPLLGEAGQLLSPRRVPVHWAKPPGAGDFALGRFPVNFWQLPVEAEEGVPGFAEFYALPVPRPDGRVKTAPHNRLEGCDPERIPDAVPEIDREKIRAFLKRCIPSLADADLQSHHCLYAMTPNGDFRLGPLPGRPRVVVAVLAGHGFKFAPVLGEILADLLQGDPPGFDVRMFRPA